MPLKEACSRKGFKHNLKKLQNEGYSDKKAYAIAVEKAKENKNKCSEKRQAEIENGEFL